MPWGRWVWPGHCLEVFARRRGWTEAEQRECIVCKGSSGFDRGQRVTTLDVSERVILVCGRLKLSSGKSSGFGHKQRALLH